MRPIARPEVDTLVDDYQRVGFAYVRQLFTADDLASLIDALDQGGASPGGFSVADSQGGQQELSVWTHLGNDLVGRLSRLDRIVSLATAVVGEPVCHWHSKLSWKRPGTDTLWDWHQDYGFWFAEGVARPDMCTIAVAVTPVTEANGAMRLVPGSQEHGRIEVTQLGEGQGSDPTVVTELVETHGTELCELEVGDAVIFHSNTLHASGPNRSGQPRTMWMGSYNAVSNPPAEPSPAGRASEAIDPLPDEALVNGWPSVFGETAFIDPTEQGLTQGYDTKLL